MSDRFQAAITEFDAANCRDPNVVTVDGVAYPGALLYAQRMTQWLDRLAPQASEALKLAARCQHICRWEIPRDRYPMTREGYHEWRSELASFHADKAEQILAKVGYDEETIARVRELLVKKNLKTDSETQILEDVICVVFLGSYFADFSTKHDRDKVIRILRRTWQKMSPLGRKAALQLDLREDVRGLVSEAIA